MKILALETSATAASACLWESGRIVAEYYLDNKLTHSQTVLPMAQQMLQMAGCSIKDIDLFAVAVGPGSFTGLRIGIAAVKGLCDATGRPCVGAPTLEALAYNQLGHQGVVCATMDARRQQVYTALFRVNGGEVTRLTEDEALSLEDLKKQLEQIDEPVVLVGDGAQLSYQYLTQHGLAVTLAPPAGRLQHASSVAILAEKLANAGKITSSEELLPKYIRLPQAERERLEREASENK